MLEREYRDLAFVPRWSIVRTIKQQSVAEHSFYVAIYAEQIARYLDCTVDMGALLKMALVHDLEECFTGDIPGPGKSHFVDKEKYHEYVEIGLNQRFNMHMPKLSDEELLQAHGVIKIADELDAIFFLCGEIQMGNQSVYGVYFSRIKGFRTKFHQILKDVFNRSEAEISDKWGSMERMINVNQNNHSKVAQYVMESEQPAL